MRRGRDASPARAASLVAALALALGAPTRAREPAPCPAPEREPAPPGAPPRVRCDGRGGAPLGAEALLFGLRLDLNRAGAAALEALPGVGPARAAAIAREAAARPFCDVAELERVPGIGPVTRARLAPWVRVGAGGGCGP